MIRPVSHSFRWWAGARISPARVPIMMACALVMTPLLRAQTNLKRDLDLALKSVPHASTVTGVCVIDLASGETVYTRAPDTPMTPASSMKLFVMAAAIEWLGLDFEFETILATDGHSLFLIGGGDPGLGDEKLSRARNEPQYAVFARWSDAIVASGRAAFDGDLIIDETIFDDEYVHPSWELRDLGKWFAAPVGGLNLNDNCVDITIAPAESVDAPVRVIVEPENTLVTIRNYGRTGPGGTPIVYHPPNSTDYRISGRCNKRWPFPPVSFPYPGLFTADAMRVYMKERGVTIAGEVKRRRVRAADGSLPGHLTVLGRNTTKLADILPRVGKNSQNMFAECLLKRTGKALAMKQGQAEKPGSWALGAEAVLETMSRVGVSTDGLVVADGSGLSRDNRCSVRQITSLLAWMHSRPGGKLLRESLSVAGVDGSLSKRLRNLPNVVQAKTGTMKRIRTLAGYISDQGTPVYAFAVFFNEYVGSSLPYKGIQDRICRILATAAEASREE